MFPCPPPMYSYVGHVSWVCSQMSSQTGPAPPIRPTFPQSGLSLSTPPARPERESLRPLRSKRAVCRSDGESVRNNDRSRGHPFLDQELNPRLVLLCPREERVGPLVTDRCISENGSGSFPSFSRHDVLDVPVYFMIVFPEPWSWKGSQSPDWCLVGNKGMSSQ